MSQTFYGSFYGFHSPPFHITPDSSNLFSTGTHLQASGAIEYGISAGKGFIVVTGEVGVGKTTILRGCLDRLESSKTKIIYLFNPALSVAELYSTIVEELDESDQRGPPTQALRTLQEKLLGLHSTGIQVVLAVDEAQNMPEETLESLRMLSNLETSANKLLQIILIGQPELEATLAKHKLRQLAQRIAVRARINPLTFGQSCDYIRHRSTCAGRVGRSTPFSALALWYLALKARGIPRNINICCDNALINGYGHGAAIVSLRMARESYKSLRVRSTIVRVVVGACQVFLVIGTLFACLYLSPGVSSGVQIKHYPTKLFLSTGQASGSNSMKASDTLAIADKGPSGDTQSNPSGDTHPGLAESDPLSLQQSPAKGSDGSSETAQSSLSYDVDSHFSAPRFEPHEWLVRRGDTIYKACRITYGVCDDRAIRAIIAGNPHIGPNGLIRAGQIIELPSAIAPLSAN